MTRWFRRSAPLFVALMAALFLPNARPVLALDGGTLRIDTDNGWLAFEVISQGDDPSGDGYDFSMPGTFDGAGGWLVDPSTLRVQSNHELSDASVSEVDIDLANLVMAIENTIASGTPMGVGFVISARQAYGRVSYDGGASWTSTSSASNTSFYRFCSSQAYAADTFGPDRGFVDPLYITGEEGSDGGLYVIDSVARDFYQLSGNVGSAPGGIGGMPFDNWENAALLDTGETSYVALLLSPDGGTRRLQLYIGHKGLDASGNASSSFLARNGLAYGSYYYLNGTLPDLGDTHGGTFDTTTDGALATTKMEDIDTSPSHPTRVVLGNQDYGVHTLDFDLDFTSGGFDAGSSSFTVTRIESASGGEGAVSSPDNVDWTAATHLGDTDYPDGLIFVNEDNGSGEIWMITPTGSGDTRVGATTLSTESTGIFDISEFVGYRPGSVLITNSQGSTSSMTVLINPDATLAAWCGDGSCGSEEDASSCPGDCSAVCGDGAITHAETCDGDTESCTSHGGYAGDDATCNGTCSGWDTSTCRFCGDGTCDSSDGETTATCAGDCPASCGDGTCDGGETTDTCPFDCPAVCGDGTCDAFEDSSVCPADCATAPPPSEGGGGGGCTVVGAGGSGPDGAPLPWLLLAAMGMTLVRRRRRG